MAKWTEPASREEAERRRLDLVEKINDINAQLSKFRIGARDEYGNHLKPDTREFFAWRASAIAAKRYAEADLARVKAWIKQDNITTCIRLAANAAPEVDFSDPTSMLRALYVLVHRLACEGVELDPAEQVVKDGVRAYLDNPNRGAMTA